MLCAQRINHIIEHGACPLGFCPGVKACGRIQPFVSEDLPYHFIIARLLVEEYLSGKMSEQVNVERVTGKLKDSIFDLQTKRVGGFVFSVSSWKQGISWFTDQMWPILSHVPAQDLQCIWRDVKIHRMPVFGFAFANDQMDALALRLQVPMDVDGAKIGFADRCCLQQRDCRRHLR